MESNTENFNLDFSTITFSKVNGDNIENIIQYIINYLDMKDSDTIKISIGCDSKNKAIYTLYVFSIAFYDEFNKNGTHYVKASYHSKRIKDDWTRLHNEAIFLKDLGNYLENGLVGYYKPNYKYTNHEMKNSNFSRPTKLVEVHLDLNPQPFTKVTSSKKNIVQHSNKSNSVYGAGVSLLASDGFKVVTKPYAHTSSSAADKHTK